ncbi:MAG TPA: SEC-C domain-containing protein [Myxococcaceae bacterium]|jgi:hypothetical protein
MATLPRNAPCACGSGKKVKQCCGAHERVVALAPGAAIHRRDERLVKRMVTFATERFGREWLLEPMEAYFLLRQLEQDDLQLFMPWVTNHWRVQGRPVREWFLEECGDKLTEAEHDWLLAQAGTVLSVWEVLQVYEGEGVRVKDLLCGEERIVHEVKGSRTVTFREAMLARVVDHEGLSVFCGVYPRTLPPREADAVVRAVRGELRVRGGGLVPREKLAAEGADLGLIHLWTEAVLELEKEEDLPPLLVNLDGEPLLFTTDRFTFPPGERTRVLERLRGLEGAELFYAGPPVDIVFRKMRGKLSGVFHAGNEGFFVGRAVVEQGRLRLESNSVQRADALRARVEAACEGLLTHQEREHAEPQALLEEAETAAQALGEELPDPEPELLEALRELKAQHYAGWVDAPLPVLKGKTPREAVRTPAGRRRVELLLKELEHCEALLPESERTDLTPLRGELGLKE